MTSTVTFKLTKTDRCDRCNAPARTVALLDAGRLMFCQHHTNQYEAALCTTGAQIIYPEVIE